MKLFLIAVLAWSGSQGDFDWHRQQSRLEINQALTNWSRACSREFGFTALESQPPAVMQGRIEAHLLLAGTSAIIELSDWTRLVTDWTDREGLAARGGDALLAAIADPGAYERAETLYVETIMGGLRRFYEGCRRGARMDFIHSNYLGGDGAIPPEIEGQIREAFRRDVEELRREQPQPSTRATPRSPRRAGH